MKKLFLLLSIISIALVAMNKPDTELKIIYAFENAVQNGNTAKVSRMLEAHPKQALARADVLVLQSIGRFAEHYNIEIANLILKKAKELTQNDPSYEPIFVNRFYGQTNLLMDVAIQNRTTIAQLLLELGAKKGITNRLGKKAYDYAKTDVMKALLKPDEKDL